MPLTAIELQRRAARIGASDVPVIVMGPMFPWAKDYNGRTLWLEKTNRCEHQPESQAMQIGNDLEVALLGYANRVIGKVSRRHKQVKHPNGVMIATLDGRLVDRRETIECKVPGMSNSWYDKERWGNWETPITSAATAEGVIPVEHYWQMAAQLACLNANLRYKAQVENRPITEDMLYTGGYLVVVLHGTKKVLRHYHVLRNNDEIATLENLVCDWWDEFIVADVEPPVEMTPETARRVFRTEDGWVNVPNALFEAVKAAQMAEEPVRAQYNALVAARERAEAQLLGAAGPHTKMHCDAGHRLELVTTQVSPKPYNRTGKKYLLVH